MFKLEHFAIPKYKMRQNILIIALIIFIIITSCSNHKLANRYYECGDSIKINSLNFINDSICIYKQSYLIDMPKPYRQTQINCLYKLEHRKIVLKNRSQNRDSIEKSCFKIPEDVLTKINFFKPDTLKNKRILIGAPPTFSRIDLYGYINNIIEDTLNLNVRKILYIKENDCFEYYMIVKTPFKRKKY
jgi:hypothetical protein